ncbi:histidine kinase [Undibacterium cyanobacteriorum]|uniref:Histidine kinase n=1 Tax=Undibacterium cyanobacteriorum TaxID=3073561 RepID=A0ABY9RFC0_9BURK|nr:histidine kinase [Undibacterium sp. 20NA77.5]WMW79927.1 histidine kinase [Undibacterium sp. 20NA77.5]
MKVFTGWTAARQWYREWDEEMLAVLQRPELAETTKLGYRRKFARQIAQLSEIERMQLREFSLKYRGAYFWRSVLKLSLLFSLIGIVIAYFKPAHNPYVLLGTTVFVGWALITSLIGVWFNYRKINRSLWRTLLKLFAYTGLGMLSGAGAAVLFSRNSGLDRIREIAPGLFWAVLAFAGTYVFLIGVVATWRNQAFETRAAQLALDAEKARHAEQQSKAELRLLRAQIEPHFLFNTLGAVQQLAEGKAPEAAMLTKNLIAFLRSSTQMIRAEAVSLAQEFEMIRAYLEVMKVRMGARLQISITPAPEFENMAVPSMALLTLVENAIKHGLEPSLSGGGIAIFTEVVGDRLGIYVRDTGIGLSEKPGQGVGLENVRERLRLMYGENSTLDLYEHADGGVMAEVKIPLPLDSLAPSESS